MRIYVGNLSFDTTNEDLRAAFAVHGEVSSAESVMDRDTGRARGFGFVEMANESEARAAISALSGAQLQGRTLTVDEAKSRSEGGSRGGGRTGGYERSSGNRRW